MSVILSDRIQEEIVIRPGFKDFVSNAVKKHLAGDWGEISQEDAEHNRENPLAAISAFTFENEIKIYIKCEWNAIRVFLPEEY